MDASPAPPICWELLYLRAERGGMASAQQIAGIPLDLQGGIGEDRGLHFVCIPQQLETEGFEEGDIFFCS